MSAPNSAQPKACVKTFAKRLWLLFAQAVTVGCGFILAYEALSDKAQPPDQNPDAIERIVTIVPTRVRQLLVPHILNGELAIELPSIAEKKAYIAKQLTEETWESELRIEMPHKHYVNMTPAVAECRSKMYAELHGGKV